MNNKINFINISKKVNLFRIAKAQGDIILNSNTINDIISNRIFKGDVLTLSKAAAISAIKKTDQILILAHSINIEYINIEHEILNCGIRCKCTVVSNSKTGVEMEALIGVNVFLLTIYDMCKSIDKKMTMNGIFLIEKKKV